jgi:hypothetical protein
LTTHLVLDEPEFAQWVEPLISRLVPLLLHPKAPRSLHENAAVSIGRIGLMHPRMVAPALPDFAQAWCQALFEIRDNEEKDSAFRGLCTLVQVNPMGIAKVRWVRDFVRVFTYGTIYIEFVVVLQRYRALEPTVGGAQLDVPSTVGGFQDPRPAGLGSASTNVPSRYSGTPRTALLCLTTINSTFHLYPPFPTKKLRLVL